MISHIPSSFSQLIRGSYLVDRSTGSVVPHNSWSFEDIFLSTIIIIIIIMIMVSMMMMIIYFESVYKNLP